MAQIRFSLAEAVAVIRQNIGLPPAIRKIYAAGREIGIVTAYGLIFHVFYKSFSDGWLEMEVQGGGWMGKLISLTLGAKLLDILAPQFIASGAAHTRGHSVFLDTGRLLGRSRGIHIRDIRDDGDCLTILVDVAWP